MKSILLTSIALLICCFLSAQTLITSFGGFFESSDGGCLSFSVGELAVETLAGTSKALTQGFQQPDLLLRPPTPHSINIINGLIVDDEGGNNIFTIRGLEEYPENELFILNRWGEVLFHAQPYLNDWKGYYENRPLPQATYYYVLKFDPNQTAMKGNLYILKK